MKYSTIFLFALFTLALLSDFVKPSVAQLDDNNDEVVVSYEVDPPGDSDEYEIVRLTRDTRGYRRSYRGSCRTSRDCGSGLVCRYIGRSLLRACQRPLRFD